MRFTLTPDHLHRLFDLNGFPTAEAPLVFAGLRGALPVNTGDHAFRSRQDLHLAEIDYQHPRCTLIQWRPATGELAAFPGSTVPHRRYVQRSLARSGRGANCLMTGYYADYRRGVHRAGSPTGHAAFRQTGARALRRTADDFDYDGDDRVEFGNPYDNLHAAWCMGVDHDGYASAGCQVVVGYPACEQRGDRPDAGAWAVFRANAYEAEPAEAVYPYALLTGRDGFRVAETGGRGMVRVRFGSEGELARRVQAALAASDHYEGRLDGLFGPRSVRALLAFQEAAFGAAADDGIAGPVTASALGVDWPD